jgi:hypothetical protein
VASLWRAAWHWTHDTGVVCVNVAHYKARNQNVGINDADAQHVADALAAAQTVKYLAVVSNKFTLNNVVVTEVITPGSGAVPDQGSHAIGTRGSITVSGDLLPIQVATLVSLYTNAAVRSGHGRQFLPNPGFASYLDSTGIYDTTANYWTTLLPPLLTQWLAGFSVSYGTGIDQKCSMVIYSHKRHVALNPNYYFDVITATPRAQLHWLRSRSTAP